MHAMRLLFTGSASDDDPSYHQEPTEEEQAVGSIVAIVFSLITVFLVLTVIFGPMLSPYDWWYGQPEAGYVKVVQLIPGKLHGSKAEIPPLSLRVPPPDESNQDRTQTQQPRTAGSDADAKELAPPAYDAVAGV